MERCADRDMMDFNEAFSDILRQTYIVGVPWYCMMNLSEAAEVNQNSCNGCNLQWLPRMGQSEAKKDKPKQSEAAG